MPTEVRQQITLLCIQPRLVTALYLRTLLPRRVNNVYKLFKAIFRSAEYRHLKDAIFIGDNLYRLIDLNNIQKERESTLVLVAPFEDIALESLRPHIRYTYTRGAYREISFRHNNIRLFVQINDNIDKYLIPVTHPKKLFRITPQGPQTSYLAYGGLMRIKDTRDIMRILSDGARELSVSRFAIVELGNGSYVHVSYQTGC